MSSEGDNEVKDARVPDPIALAQLRPREQAPVSLDEEIQAAVRRSVAAALEHESCEVEQIELCPLSISALRTVVETVRRRETARHAPTRSEGGQVVELRTGRGGRRSRSGGHCGGTAA